MSIVEKRASEGEYKTVHLSKYDRCPTYMWLYWEELKSQFLFAFHQVKTHSKILPVESLFIIVFFFVILQTDRYNIHSQLEHCKYEVSLIPVF